MESDGTVEIWAKDFNKGSFDNCSLDTSLVYSFSTNILDKSKVFRCADMTDKVTTFDLKMYVTDASGNFDFCTVKIKYKTTTTLVDLV